MRELGELVAVPGERGICRDPDDDPVIETAAVGRADVLVSGDADLLDDPAVAALLTHAGVQLLMVAELVSVLESQGS
jgi:predicted nucleic acid-binding protein